MTARDGRISDPEKIFTNLHVNWVRASATGLRRVLVDSDGGNLHLATYADDVLENCDVCGAFDMAPRVPIAGASAVSTFNEKLQGGLLFLSALIALHAVDMFPKYSLLLPAHSKDPQEVWGGWAHLALPSAFR